MVQRNLVISTNQFSAKKSSPRKIDLGFLSR